MSYNRRSVNVAKRRFKHLSPKYIAYFFGIFVAYWLLISVFHGIIQDNHTVFNKIFHPSRIEILHRVTTYILALIAFHFGIAIELHLDKYSKQQTLTYWREMLISSEISEHMIFYDKNLTILWSNGAAARSLGLTQDDIKGKKCYELWHGRTEPCEGCPVIGAMKTGTTKTKIVQTPDGRHYYIRGYPLLNDHGEVDGAAEITLEITDLKKAEREAKEKSERLEAILSSVSDGVVITDTYGKVTYVNNAFERITSIKPEDAIGSPIDKLLSLRNFRNESRIIIPAYRIQTLRPGESITYTGIVKCKGEDTKLIAAVCAPITSDESSEAKGAVFSIRDITENEKERAKSFEKIKALCLGKLAYTIANEIEDWIHSFSSIVSTIKSTPSSVNYDNLHTEIDKSIKDMNKFLRMLRNFNIDKSSPLSPTDVREILREATEVTSSNLQVFETIPESIPKVLVNKHQTETALTLLLDAIDGLFKRQMVVELSASEQTLAFNNEFGVDEGKYIAIDLKFREQLPQLELTEITNPLSSSTCTTFGLKFNIASTLIKANEGTIKVLSSLSGTNIRLLMRASQQNRTREVKKSMSASNGEARRILVMDDEEIVRKAVAKILQFYGYEVELASTGDEAVEKYRQWFKANNPFDAVILDLTVKNGMGGKEAAEQILKTDKKARLILSSGFLNKDEVIDYKRYGFSASISKPYKAEKLNEVLASVLSPGHLVK